MSQNLAANLKHSGNSKISFRHTARSLKSFVLILSQFPIVSLRFNFFAPRSVNKNVTRTFFPLRNDYCSTDKLLIIINTFLTINFLVRATCGGLITNHSHFVIETLLPTYEELVSDLIKNFAILLLMVFTFPGWNFKHQKSSMRSFKRKRLLYD